MLTCRCLATKGAQRWPERMKPQNSGTRIRSSTAPVLYLCMYAKVMMYI